MHFDSIDELLGAVDRDDVRSGDVVYLSPSVYATVGDRDRRAIWERLLRARVRVVTDLPVPEGITVSRSSGGLAEDRGTGAHAGADAGSDPRD
jgi:hypothetical protein